MTSSDGVALTQKMVEPISLQRRTGYARLEVAERLPGIMEILPDLTAELRMVLEKGEKPQLLCTSISPGERRSLGGRIPSKPVILA